MLRCHKQWSLALEGTILLYLCPGSESMAQGEGYTGGVYQLSKVSGHLVPESLYMAPA